MAQKAASRIATLTSKLDVSENSLVEKGFRTAEGERLEHLDDEDPEPQGHSIEFRINGEGSDPVFVSLPWHIHASPLPEEPSIPVGSIVTNGDCATGAFDSRLVRRIVALKPWSGAM